MITRVTGVHAGVYENFNVEVCPLRLACRRDTKKFNALVANPKVAVLIHDFDGNRRSKYMAAAAQSTPKSDATDISEAGTASVTVYGVCQVADGELERRLRDLHRSNVPDDQEYFVCGDDVAMLAIVPTQARLCNINDQITTWRPDRSDSFGSAGAGAPCDVPQ